MRKTRILFSVILLFLVLVMTACGGDAMTDEIKVGQPAPGFTLTTSEGSEVSLSDFRGQPVLLFFHMAGG